MSQSPNPGTWADGGGGSMMQVELDLAVFFPNVHLLLEGPGSHTGTELGVSGLTLLQKSLSVLQKSQRCYSSLGTR